MIIRGENDIAFCFYYERLKEELMFAIQILTWYVMNLAHVHVGNMLLPCSSHSLRTTVTCAQFYCEKQKCKNCCCRSA